MAEARSRENWAHTSSLLAMLANVNRDPKKTKPFKPSDFDPFLAYGNAGKSSKPVIRKGEDFDILKMAFVDAQTGKKGTGL